MENTQIAAVFTEIADILEILGENAFRVRSYRNAARSIDDLTEPRADLVAAGRLSFPQVGIEAVEHMLSADAGVLMSDPAILAEGCPNSIMEYMACGLPVVCADSGGCRELTRDGETGFVVPPRDAGALAARLTYLRDHPDEGARMGEAGRVRVATEFTGDTPHLLNEIEKLKESIRRDPGFNNSNPLWCALMQDRPQAITRGNFGGAYPDGNRPVY